MSRHDRTPVGESKSPNSIGDGNDFAARSSTQGWKNGIGGVGQEMDGAITEKEVRSSHVETPKMSHIDIRRISRLARGLKPDIGGQVARSYGKVYIL
jgi:hypothetical protein